MEAIQTSWKGLEKKNDPASMEEKIFFIVNQKGCIVSSLSEVFEKLTGQDKNSAMLREICRCLVKKASLTEGQIFEINTLFKECSEKEDKLQKSFAAHWKAEANKFSGSVEQILTS